MEHLFIIFNSDNYLLLFTYVGYTHFIGSQKSGLQLGIILACTEFKRINP